MGTMDRRLDDSRLAEEEERFYTNDGAENACLLGHPLKFDLEKRFAHLLRLCAEKQACSEGRALHSHCIKLVSEPNVFLSNNLVNMYSKCGFIQEAEQIFDEMLEPDIVSWNTMIRGYLLCGYEFKAFSCFKKMISCNFILDQFTFTSVLKCCENFADFYGGLQVHCCLTKFNLDKNVSVGSGLIEFYGKFYCHLDSMKVFDDLKYKDIILYNSMIGVSSQHGDFKLAFQSFMQVISSPVAPTRATFVNLLTAINDRNLLREGKEIHAQIMKRGLETDRYVESSLVGMYSNCESIEEASALLIFSGSFDLISWTILISGCLDCGFVEEAMDMFLYFYKHKGTEMDNIYAATILSVLAYARYIEFGKEIHSILLKIGFGTDLYVRDALMEMYAKCFLMEETNKVFQENSICDLWTWTVLISGNIYNRFPLEALRNLYFMQKEVNPDGVLCTYALMACIDLQATCEGEQIHGYLAKMGYEKDISVQTSLLSFYFDNGSIGSALRVFQDIDCPDVVSWTKLISSFVKLGYYEQALEQFIKLFENGAKPNHFTIASAITASTGLMRMEMGRMFHTHVLKIGLERNNFVGCSLIDMYSKCGEMDDAVKYFNYTEKLDITLWNSLLAGWSHHGNGLEVLKVFEEIKTYRVEPDWITFLLVLSGCSHGGLPDKVIYYFNLMYDVYDIYPREEHYACVVDAFGRSRRFKEAIKFLEGTEVNKVTIEALRAFLNSCIVHRYTKLGLAVVAKIIEFGEHDTATHVSLSNLYAIDGRWNEAMKVRQVMETSCVGKVAGRSLIETNIVLD